MEKKTKEILLNLFNRSYIKKGFKNNLIDSPCRKKNNFQEYNEQNQCIKNTQNENNENKLKNYNNLEIFEGSSKDIRNYIDNKENFSFNQNKEKIFSDINYLNQSKNYYQKISNIKSNKILNDSNNESSKDCQFNKNLIKGKNIMKVNNASLKDKVDLNLKNILITNQIKKRKAKQKIINKINFNNDSMPKQYFSTINIFQRNKNNDLNIINIPTYKQDYSLTTKNNKQGLISKKNYLNNLYHKNITEFYKGKKTNRVNSNNKSNFDKKEEKKSKEKKSNLIICFNNDNNQIVSNRIRNKIVPRKKNENSKIISNTNNKIKNRNSNNKNIRRLIFTFERMKSEKYLTQNLTNININKFINEDGTKDDISYKINKRKYLSSKLSTQKNKTDYLFSIKNRKIENNEETYSSRLNNNKFKMNNFESNIKHSKSLLNNIKLGNNNKEYNKNEINNKINYFNKSNYQKDIKRTKSNHLINSIPIGNNKLKFIFYKKRNKYKNLNKGNIQNFSNYRVSNEEEKEYISENEL